MSLTVVFDILVEPGVSVCATMLVSMLVWVEAMVPIPGVGSLWLESCWYHVVCGNTLMWFANVLLSRE